MPVILYISSEAGLRSRIRDCLGDGFELIEVASASDGADSIRQSAPACVVFADDLGAGAGLQLLHELGALRIPAVVITTETREPAVSEALLRGASDAFPIEVLAAERLRAALRHSMARAELERFSHHQAEELVRFVGLIAHDLKEPLRGMTHLAELLRLDLEAGDRERVEWAAARIIQLGKNGSHLVGNLRAYLSAGRGERQREIMDLNALLGEVLQALEKDIRAREATIEVGDLPTEVEGDHASLFLVFENLLDNALKFHRSDEPPRVRIESSRSGDRWRFSVIDNGIGIEEANFEKVFAPLQRIHTRGEYEGSALGLAICQRIVEQGGGELWVESEAGRGSTFSFTITDS